MSLRQRNRLFALLLALSFVVTTPVHAVPDPVVGWWGPTDAQYYHSQTVHDPLSRYLHSGLSLLAVPEPDLLIRWAKAHAQSCVWVSHFGDFGQRPGFCHPDSSWVEAP